MEKTEILQWLSDHGFDPARPTRNNSAHQHALILAAQQDQPAVLKHLLDQGADPAVLDAYGNTALWAACYAEAYACIDTLLAAGANIDYQNPAGATALIYAASSGKQRVVAKLLQAGADPMLTTQDDFSALDLAASRPCLTLLRQAVKEFGPHAVRPT